MEEDKIVEEYLKKFLIGSESSFLDTIDIILVLRANPNPLKGNEEKTQRTKLFNFFNLQNSLIKFLNSDLVNAFEYYDEKNRMRV